jgi:hypothetical protein
LTAVLNAHGGVTRWSEIKSIQATFNLSGQLFSSVGYPAHRQTTVTIDAHRPRAVFTGLGERPDERWSFLPNKVLTEKADGSELQSLDNPRSTFPASQWDDTHLLYFTGYAVWGYLTAPFLFTQPGFKTRELEDWHENGETWRVLEVVFPDDIPTHNRVQQFMFDEKFMLRRLDYAPEVLGSSAAYQYVFDPYEVGGLIFPRLRRVVPKSSAGVFGPALVLLDFCNISVI